ncbi:hypothetical protein EYV94_21350 [Puteibacter caeruleilacunae]|nr:hypothetical protein EYV94_21350 [Puteibacter caeruleilacunae]
MLYWDFIKSTDMEEFYGFFYALGIVILLIIFLYFFPVALWLSATVCGVKISLWRLFLMKIKGMPVDEIVRCLITIVKANLDVTRKELEDYYLSGGNIQDVIFGMVAAKNAGFILSFKEATSARFKDVDFIKSIKDNTIEELLKSRLSN